MSYTITKGIKRVDGCEDFELCGVDSFGCKANLSVSFNDRDEIVKVKSVSSAEIKEWPCVGSRVVVESDNERYREIKGRAVTVIGICNHSDGDEILTVEHKSLGVFAITNGDWVKKPKTPEESLRDDIEYAIHNFEGDKVAGRKWLTSRYNITPKS